MSKTYDRLNNFKKVTVVFGSISDYLLEARLGDRILLSNETDEFLAPEYKLSTFQVVDIFNGITLKRYHSSKRILLETDQRIKVISKKDFNKLKI